MASRLGDDPVNRIRLPPWTDRLCELIDGVLVEKTSGRGDALGMCFFGNMPTHGCVV